MMAEAGKIFSFRPIPHPRIIHVVRCLQTQGRGGFAILAYAKPLMTRKMRADRYAFGEQFGECF